MIKKALAFIVVTLLAAAIGAAQGLKMSEMIVAEATHAPKKPVDSHGPKSAVRELKPIVTNLGGGGSSWVRLEASLIVDPDFKLDEKKLVDITNDIVAYLRTVTPAQVEGVAGLRRLREDLSERLSVRTDKKIHEILIQTMVVQ
jgi:flagellar FliL protein